MQRLFRDVHAGTQHITSAPGVIKAAGKELAGLAPDGPVEYSSTSSARTPPHPPGTDPGPQGRCVATSTVTRSGSPAHPRSANVRAA